MKRGASGEPPSPLMEGRSLSATPPSLVLKSAVVSITARALWSRSGNVSVQAVASTLRARRAGRAGRGGEGHLPCASPGNVRVPRPRALPGPAVTTAPPIVQRKGPLRHVVHAWNGGVGGRAAASREEQGKHQAARQGLEQEAVHGSAVGTRPSRGRQTRGGRGTSETPPFRKQEPISGREGGPDSAQTVAQIIDIRR